MPAPKRAEWRIARELRRSCGRGAQRQYPVESRKELRRPRSKISPQPSEIEAEWLRPLTRPVRKRGWLAGGRPSNPPSGARRLPRENRRWQDRPHLLRALGNPDLE